MNICFVNSTRKWGGVKSWTLDIAKGLAEKGHVIHIIARPGVFVEKTKEAGLNAWEFSFGPDFNPLAVFSFIKFFKKKKIDVLVVNVGKDMRTAGIAAKLLKIPVVHRIGLSGDLCNTFKIRNVHKWVSPHMLAPCQEIKNGILKNLPFLDPNEFTVIITGKESTQYPPEPIHAPLRFITTSQLNADKGHKDVLRAVAKLKEQNHDFEYHIVGTGRIESKLKLLASQLGIDDKIVWHGFQKDVRMLLKASDVFILPSYREGLPNSLLEAMSEGLACIARDVGGINEIWPIGNGFCLPANADSSYFALAMDRMLTMPHHELAALRRIFWEATPSRKSMIDNMETLLSSLNS
jgi:glycosyltransferase involved in cell wall biosynthesis